MSEKSIENGPCFLQFLRIETEYYSLVLKAYKFDQ